MSASVSTETPSTLIFLRPFITLKLLAMGTVESMSSSKLMVSVSLLIDAVVIEGGIVSREVPFINVVRLRVSADISVVPPLFDTSKMAALSREGRVNPGVKAGDLVVPRF